MAATRRGQSRDRSTARSSGSSGGEGIAIDKSGDAAFDPSANVNATIDRAEWRQDDLREINNRYLEALINCLREESKTQREHAKEIRDLETSRVNAVRQVDVLAGQTTAAEARQAIQTLAATTSATAEGLRNTVATAAAALASSTAATTAEISKRVAVLEQSIAVGAGRSAVADPIQTQLLEEVKALRTASTTGTAKAEGSTATWGIIGGLLFLAIAIVTVGITIATKL